MFLKVSPSSQFNGMGSVGNSLPTNDVFGFYYNPAQLGNFAKNNNFGFQFYPQKTDWQKDLGPELNNFGMSVGYKPENSLFSFGFGFLHSHFDYGTFDYTNEFGTKDEKIIGPTYSYQAFSLGINYDWIIDFNAGVTFKNIKGKNLLLNYNEFFIPQDTVKLKTQTFDFGILATIPFGKISSKSYDGKYFLNASLGFSVRNLGGSVKYPDKEESELMPRTSVLGYSLVGGYEGEINGETFDFVKLSWSVDAEDDLTKKVVVVTDGKSTLKEEYQNILANTNPWKNIILAEGSSKIIRHLGFKVELFETFSFMKGSLDGDGFDGRKTIGFGFSSKGISKYLYSKDENEIFEFLSQDVELKYFHSSFFDGSDIESKFNGVSLVLKNIF
ncbi:MAG: hypothetical protein DWQ06_06685 [Calditrichaeota bacterium]|nr:MAG: hypothetical protein DWQ06_06685 [Calditrichota bacterium]